MSDMKIVSESPINSYTLRKELEKIKKRDGELNFRASRTEEYLHQVADLKNAEKLFEKLMALEIPRVRDVHVHKIIDVCPTTVNDLKVVLQGYTITVSADGMKKIVETINEFLEKK